jgi:endonuclease YncB( thermonuclease family)
MVKLRRSHTARAPLSAATVQTRHSWDMDALLGKLVFHRHVEARCYKVDRWKRDVCRVYEGGSDVGLEQVRAGMAWHATPYLREQTPQEREEYARAEQAARADGRGLWIDPNPIPPLGMA